MEVEAIKMDWGGGKTAQCQVHCGQGFIADGKMYYLFSCDVPLCAFVCLGVPWWGLGRILGGRGQTWIVTRPRDCRDETEKALDGMRLCSVSRYGSAAVVFQKWT